MEADDPESLDHLTTLRTMAKPDVVKMVISARRMLQHPDAVSDGLEVELRAFIEQVDTIAW